MKEPLFNTVSNLSYIPAGVGVVVLCFVTPWISFGTAAGLLILALASSIFHFQRKPDGSQGRLGVLGWAGGHADKLGMYWTFTGLLLLGVVHQGWIKRVVVTEAGSTGCGTS